MIISIIEIKYNIGAWFPYILVSILKHDNVKKKPNTYRRRFPSFLTMDRIVPNNRNGYAKSGSKLSNISFFIMKSLIISIIMRRKPILKLANFTL